MQTDKLYYYLELLIRDTNLSAADEVWKLIQESPEIKNQLNLSLINDISKKYIDEQRAKTFQEYAIKCENLEQKGYLLSIASSLVPTDSHIGYEIYIAKAEAELLKCKVCLNKDFREQYKQENNLTEEELSKLFQNNSEKISELYFLYAIQALDEAVRFAKTLEEVNNIDKKIKEIVHSSTKHF